MRLLLSFLLLLTLNAYAQTRYREDLSALRSIRQRTPSFQAQIRGQKLDRYDYRYQQIYNDTVSNPNSYAYFYHLAQLLFPLRDNHLGFYQVPDYTRFRSKPSIDSFVASNGFNDYPNLALDLDSLEQRFTSLPSDSIEGIYHYDTFYRVGLFRSKENEYLGVILNSRIALWLKGQVAIYQFS